MFEVGKTYKTTSGKDAHISDEIRIPGNLRDWLIGWVSNNGSVRTARWCKHTGMAVDHSNTHIGWLDLAKPTITLELTLEEAQTLRELQYAHIHGPNDGPRGHMDSIGSKLELAGVKTEGLPEIAAESARLWLANAS